MALGNTQMVLQERRQLHLPQGQALRESILPYHLQRRRQNDARDTGTLESLRTDRADPFRHRDLLRVTDIFEEILSGDHQAAVRFALLRNQLSFPQRSSPGRGFRL